MPSKLYTCPDNIRLFIFPLYVISCLNAFYYFILLGVYVQDSVQKARSVSKGFCFSFKASNWRGKKNPFSSCVRTFEGTFERSSLFWLQWRAVQWLQWNGKVNYIYIWKSCFCLTDLQSKIHICCFSIFLSSSASLHRQSLSTVSCHLNIGRWGEKIQRHICGVFSGTLV